MSINIELFLDVREAILKEYKHVHMDDWARIGNGPDGNGNHCNTTGCVAGWTCFLEAKPKRITAKSIAKAIRSKFNVDDPEDDLDYETTARELLGISFEDGRRIFLMHFGNDGYGTPLIEWDHDIEIGTPEYSKQVVSGIDAFLAEKGFDVPALLKARARRRKRAEQRKKCAKAKADQPILITLPPLREKVPA